jgi:hypothetical protein
MSFATFAANAGDLWFRAMDDIACVLYSAGQLMILVLDHEELITLSRLGASQAARHPGHAGQKRRVRDSGPGSLDVRFRAINSGNERSLTVTHSVGAHKGFGACEEEEGRPGLRTVFAARSR